MAIRDRLQQRLVTLPQDAERLVRKGPEDAALFDVESIWTDVVGLYQTGLHPAIALCIRHRNKVVLNRTIGHVENPPGGEAGKIATPDTPFSLFSASKMMTAMVVLSLMEDGVLDVDAPAVHYFPEFGRHGKDKICLRHLLNHTAGIEDMPKGLDREGFLENGRLSVESLAELRPKQAPGLKVAYHPMTSWLVLNEIIERVTGQDLRQLLKTKFLSPLGFERLNYGVPEEDISLVAKHAHTGPPVISLMNRVFERTVGLDPSLIELSNEPRFLTGLHPSANVIGTAFETARFMQMLLNGGELDGVRVLQEDTVRRAITEVTQSQIDGTFLMPVKYGLGTMVGGKLFSFFGMGTQGAFGHLGFSTVVVYADPRRDLCVALLNSGKPMLAVGMLRWLWVLQRIALIVRPKGGRSP